MAYNPTTIANYFITTYGTRQAPLRSHKIIGLTYLAYGWYLATSEGMKTLIKEPLICMNFGATFGTLFDNLVDARVDYYYRRLPNPQGNQSISEEDQNFLDRVWNSYSHYNGDFCNAAFFKSDNPWRQTIITGRKIIPMQIVFEYFRDQLKEAEANTDAV